MPTILEAFALALQHHRSGQLQAAEQIYREILRAEPNQADATHLLGVLAHQVGRHEAAIEMITRAIALNGRAAEFHHNLALVYMATRRYPEAAAACGRAVELKPDYAEAHNTLGVALATQGKLDGAIASLRRAVTLKPDWAEAHNDLGNALQAQQKLDEAVASFRRAAALAPGSAEVHNNLGVALKEQGKLTEAIDCYHRALALKPGLAGAHDNLGHALHLQGNLEEAIASSRRAVELEPTLAEAHCNLGHALKDQGQFEEAMAACRRALALKPDLAEAHYNLGLLLLQHGEYELGWREYEYRLACSPRRANWPQPRWRGERIEGRTLLIHCEQGFGDALQFWRYAPLARERSGAARVLLQTHQGLVRLLDENNEGDLEIWPERSTEAAPFPPIDLQIPLLSLPLALGIDKPWPMASPYIQAKTERRRAWRERLGITPKLRVGLAWAGNPEHKLDRLRSIPPESLLPLLNTPGVEIHSLQVGPQADRAETLQAAGLVDLTQHLGDFVDTAALVAELDLIISVDTAVAHLAGAMGRPVWTMLPFPPDWRWGLSGETTPWYPTMRLFRQPAGANWEGVVQNVATNLKSQISNLKSQMAEGLI